MTLQTQEDLFASAAPRVSVDTSFSTAKRVPIDAHSWVEVVPGWMSGSYVLFESMKGAFLGASMIARCSTGHFVSHV